MQDRLDEMAQMWNRMLVQAGQQANATAPKGAGLFEDAFFPGEYADDGNVKFSLREVDGKPVVWIEENILAAKPSGQKVTDFLVDYLTDHVGEMYTIFESGQRVYLGRDFPKEYVWSKYSQSKRNRNRQLFKAKALAASGLGEAINTATNRRWEQTKHSHNKNAKYGIYKYDSKIAFPTYNKTGGLEAVHAYSITLVIRNASDGQKYLYDIQNIKNDAFTANTLYFKSREAANKAPQQGSIISDGSIARPDDSVKFSMRFSEDAFFPGEYADDGEVKFSVRDGLAFVEDKYYARLMDRVEGAKQGSYIRVGAVQKGSVLNDVGLPAANLYFDVSKINKALSEHGDHLTKDILKQIPAILRNPVVIAEANVANTVNVFGDVQISDGVPVMVGIVVSRDRTGRNVINKVRTIHARHNYMTKITDESILYLDDNRKRTRNWFQARGNVVPLGGTQFGFIRSIAQPDDAVKFSMRSPEDAFFPGEYADDGEVKFSVRDGLAFVEDKYYARLMDRVEGAKQGGYIRVGAVQKGSVLNDVGLPAANLYFDVSKINKALSEHGDHINVAVLKKIPDILRSPVVVAEEMKTGDVNVFGDAFIGKSPLLVGIVVTQNRSGTNVINKIRTVHARKDAASKITDGSVLYLNPNQKRTRDWFQALGTHLPLGGTQFGFIRSIAQPDDAVKFSMRSPEDAFFPGEYADDGEVKFSVRDGLAFVEDKYYARLMDQVEGAKQGGYIRVGAVQKGSVLNDVGLPAANLYFDVSKINKALSEHGDHLTKDILKQIPAILRNPVVIAEANVANTVNVFGDVQISDGVPVMVGIVVSLTPSGKNVINKVRTVHARHNFMSRITDASVLYLDPNKKRTRNWFRTRGNVVPLSGTQFGFIRSIAQPDDSVKFSMRSSEESSKTGSRCTS